MCGSDFTKLNLIDGHFEPFSYKFHFSHNDENFCLLTLLSSAKRHIEEYSIVFGTSFCTAKIGAAPEYSLGHSLLIQLVVMFSMGHNLPHSAVYLRDIPSARTI